MEELNLMDSEKVVNWFKKFFHKFIGGLIPESRLLFTPLNNLELNVRMGKNSFLRNKEQLIHHCK